MFTPRTRQGQASRIRAPKSEKRSTDASGHAVTEGPEGPEAAGPIMTGDPCAISG